MLFCTSQTSTSDETPYQNIHIHSMRKGASEKNLLIILQTWLWSDCTGMKSAVSYVMMFFQDRIIHILPIHGKRWLFIGRTEDITFHDTCKVPAHIVRGDLNQWWRITGISFSVDINSLRIFENVHMYFTYGLHHELSQWHFSRG